MIIDSDTNIVQILGILALALITTGVLSLVIRNHYAKKGKDVVIDGKVSDGWKRYASKLETILTAKDGRIGVLESVIVTKDQRIFELEDLLAACGREKADLKHIATNLQAVTQVEKEVKQIEATSVKADLHEAVDASLDRLNKP